MSRAATNADFVVIMTPEGIRYTHPIPPRSARCTRAIGTSHWPAGSVWRPIPARWGRRSGDRADLGQRQGRRAASRSASTVDHINDINERRIALIGVIALGALFIGFLGSLLIARWVRDRRSAWAAGAGQLFTYYDAVLASVHEGMLLIDATAGSSASTPKGGGLLGLTDDAIGKSATDAGLPDHVAALIDDLATSPTN
jgi:sensor histidine kinase regulating citrate/malate metabolism